MNTTLKIYATGDSARPLDIQAKAGKSVAQISIIGQISNWTNANSGKVRSDIQSLGKKYDTCEVYINSQGGSCIEANEIVNILQENFKEVKVIGGAIVASAASFIFCSFPNELSKNSQVMIHEPRGYYSGTYKNIQKQLKLLKSLEDDYVAVYASKTGKSNDDIKDLWADGDHWMNAKEAKSEGFADAITGKVEITEEDAEMITAMGSPYKVVATATPEQQQKQNANKSIMDQEILAVSLGLPKDATEAQINAKIDELKAAANENATLKAQAAQAAKDAKANEIKTLLDTAEQEKKITPEMRAHYETMADTNLDSVKAIIEAAPAVTPISEQVNGKPKKPAANAGDFKYESYEACVEANDTDAWDAFAEQNPEAAEELFNKQFETK